jgi:hypothetical protein
VVLEWEAVRQAPEAPAVPQFVHKLQKYVRIRPEIQLDLVVSWCPICGICWNYCTVCSPGVFVQTNTETNAALCVLCALCLSA